MSVLFTRFIAKNNCSYGHKNKFIMLNAVLTFGCNTWNSDFTKKKKKSNSNEMYMQILTKHRLFSKYLLFHKN